MLNKFFRFVTVLLVVVFFTSSAPLFVSSQPAITNLARIRSLKQGTSTNWSGYAVQTSLLSPQAGAVTDVKGSWVVPALTCTSTSTYASAWIGIDGYSNATVEQIGTEHECINGRARYYAWFEMYPKRGYMINTLIIHAGDTMNAEVKYLGNNKFDLIIKDVTTNKQFSITERANNAKRQSAEWIVEAPYSGGVLPLANFGTTTFTNALATLNTNVGTINNPAWQNDRIDMVNGSALKALTSALTTDGTGFHVDWKSN